MRTPSFVAACLVVVAVGIGGCQSPKLPDPNDPKTVGVIAPDVLRNLLKGAATQFYSRVRTREITDAEAQQYLTEYANDLLKTVQAKDVPADRAWEYAEVLMTAKRWKDAQKFLELAVKNPDSEDRRVNDNLRLARVQATLGDVDAAVKSARSVFNAKPVDKAPILTAVLLEIVPAGEGKKKDAELALLLEEAVYQSRDAQVDPSTEAGAKYLAARPFHVRNAWEKIQELYERAGKPEEGAKAAQRGLGPSRSETGNDQSI